MTRSAGPARSADRRRVTPGRVAAAFGIAGVLYRVVLVALDVPPTNSDEGTAGLAALHIAQLKHWPVFFYGQHYMGTLHSYLAAPLVQLFGAHWWVLRLPALAMYALFLLLVFRLTRLLYTPWFAAFAVAVLALGSDRVIKDQVIGVGGYSDVATAVAGLLLVAALLTLRRAAGRWVWFVGGLLAGYVVWTHWLALPYVAVAVLLVGWARRSTLTARRLTLAGAGLLVGAAPLIWYNLRPGHPNSLSVLLSVSGATEPAALTDRLHGAIMLGLPLSSGVCAPSRCAAWQTWWGPVWLALLVTAVAMAVVAFRQADAAGRRVHAARLALLAGGALTLLAYVASASSALTPVESARYLHYGLVSLPALLWPLWAGATAALTGTPTRSSVVRRAPAHPTSVRRTVGLLALAVTCAFVAASLIATGQLVRHQPRYAAEADAQRRLAGHLLAAGLTRIYTEYWTCNRLAYATGERIRCAVLDDALRPGHDRYRPYHEQVRRAERVAYVLPRDSAAAAAFTTSTPPGVEVTEVRHAEGYRIYVCRQFPTQAR